MKCIIYGDEVPPHWADYATVVKGRIVVLCAKHAGLLEKGAVKVKIPAQRQYCQSCGRELALSSWNKDRRITFCTNLRCKSYRGPAGGENTRGDALIMAKAAKTLKERGVKVDDTTKVTEREAAAQILKGSR